ncbi:MAG: type II secretion system F family protein [Pirellulaceae bacterium]|nr:type II secretion system F family protein [Planctomycetales bacterium]
MAEFAYTAKTITGENTSGVIAANSQREAMGLLRQMSLYPLEVRDQQSTADSPWARLLQSFPRRIKNEIIADALTQLGDLLGNGVSLIESLSILSEQSADASMREVWTDVRRTVSDGRNLDDALAAHPRVFSSLCVNMVRAGLEGAFLEESLQRVASFMRKQDELRGKVVGAMAYPIVLAIVGSIITVGLVTFIVPMFESFFSRLVRGGVELPLITRILLALSHGLVRYGLVAAITITAMVLAVKRLLKSERGRRVADGLKLKIPVVGKILHDTAVSRFCRVLGTMLRNGVPILKSLDISGAAVGNVLLQEAIRESAQNISSGNLLSQPLAASGLIPAQVMAMIRVAEESNTLDQVLVKIADRTDSRVERQLDVLVRLVEPLMLLTIGGMVMFVIIGVLLPVFDLNSAID